LLKDDDQAIGDRADHEAAQTLLPASVGPPGT